jgi:hypothetical protein
MITWRANSGKPGTRTLVQVVKEHRHTVAIPLEPYYSIPPAAAAAIHPERFPPLNKDMEILPIQLPQAEVERIRYSPTFHPT